jgi:replicative DNA helicase
MELQTIEKSVITGLIVDGDTSHYIKRLSKDDFTDDRLGNIFVEIEKLYANDQPIDVQNLVMKCDESYIIALVSSSISTVHFAKHVKQLKDATSRRQVNLGIGVLQQSIYDKSVPLKDSISEFQKNLRDIEIPNEVISSKIALKRTLIDIEQRMVGEHVFINSGYGKLDEILQIEGGQLNIIAGRPSMGKTAIMLNLIYNMLVQKKRVLFFSLEMSPEENTKRILSRLTRISYAKIKKGELNNDDLKKIQLHIERVASMPLFYSDGLENDIASISMAIRNQVDKNSIECVYIDYLQLIKRTGKRSTNDLIGEITRELKLIALQCNIPIFLLSQLNRELDKQTKKEPSLSHLRDSGNIEQDADSVMFIHRPYVVGDSVDETEAKLYIKKNRSGRLGEVDLEFFGEYQYFAEVEMSKPVPEEHFR